MTIHDNSIILDTTLFTDTDEFIEAGIYLENLLRDQGLIKNRSVKRRRHIQLILANLIQAHDKGKDSVSFSRNRNDYSPPYRRTDGKPCPERYSPFGASHDPLIHAIDNLTQIGLIDGRKGYRQEIFKGAWDSSWSRMFATDKLLDLVENEFSIDPGEIGYSLYNETIRLRDADKNLIDYEDTQATSEMRKILERLNLLLDDTDLSLADIADEDEENHAIRLSQRQFMYRIFNNGSFEQGGRFNGGYWISNLPKELRKKILINGSQTVLWDFETMSLNLIYNYAGLHCKPGTSPTWWKSGMLREEWPELQKIHKKLMQIAMNSDSMDEWIGAVRGYYSQKRFAEKGTMVTERLLQEFLHKFHAPVKDHLFNKELGLHLMYTESRITEGIIKVFIDKNIPILDKNIPILPIHDGFICPMDQEELLKQTMISVYRSITGTEVSGIHKEE